MIRVQALGGLRIFVRGEESVTLSKQRLKSGLLVYLAVERSCMREVLIGTFWPEREPERARHVLSQAVYELRKQMGEEWLTIAGDRMTVADTVTVDVADFADAVRRGQYEAALRLYQGPFLDGCYLAETHEYEEWLDSQRQRLHKLLRRVLSEVSQLLEAPAWIELAIEAARKAADRDPTDDEIQHALLQLLVRAGRRSDALRQFEKYEAALAEDELEPLENTRELIATIREAPENGASALAAESQSVPVVQTAAVPSSRPVRVKRRAIGAGAIVVALGVVLPFLMSRGSNPPTRVGNASSAPRIAVLPFDVHSPDEDLDYLAAAFTEGLVDALSNVPGLDVRSRNAVRYYSSKKIPQDSLARELDVNLLIEGSVAKSGSEMRINVQLIDGQTLRVLKSRDLPRPAGDYLLMRDSVVADVAVLLRQAMGQELELIERRGETDNRKAWEDYQRASRIHDDFIAFMLENGVDAAERALARADSLAASAAHRDSHWPAAVILQGKLAAQRVQLLVYRHGTLASTSITSALEAAIRHANHAINLDRSAPDGYELRGIMRYRRLFGGVLNDTTAIRRITRDAEADLLRAVAIDSTRAEAWSTLSELYIIQSRFLEARRAAQRAYAADRYYAGASLNLYRLAVSAFETGADTEARKWCEEGRRRFPQNHQFAYCSLMLLAWSDSTMPEVDSAWALVHRAPALHASAPGSDPDPMFRMMTASVIAQTGQRDSALNVIDQARAARARTPTLLWMEAAVRARLGEYGRADRLIAEYLLQVPQTERWILQSRALKPLREEHLRAARMRERR